MIYDVSGLNTPRSSKSQELVGCEVGIPGRLDLPSTHPRSPCTQWSSLAGFFFKPVGKLGQAFSPGLSR